MRQLKDITSAPVESLTLGSHLAETSLDALAGRWAQNTSGESEEQVRQRERYLREVINALPAAIYTTDAQGRITHFNKACVEFSGRTPEIGSDHWCVTWKLYHPDGTPMPHDQCPMATALRERRTVRGAEAIAERPDGTRVWFEPYPTPLFDETGELIGGINMLVDITERKRSEETKARLAAIVESSDDAIMGKNLDSIITSWNRGAERVFGYTAQEVIGRPVTMLMPPDRVNEEPGILQRLRRGEKIDHYETIRRRKDGALLDISLTVSPLMNAAGQVIGASSIARDITERKRAERALREREAWLAGQREALEAAVNGAPLEASLGVLVRTAIEGVGEGARAGFYLANDEGTALCHVVGMPPDYAEAVDGFKIGPDSLACGLATATGRAVLTSDVKDEPLWKPWLWMAEKFDYRACWSFPIHTAARRFVGTLAIYSREPREATKRDQELGSLLTHTASIIIARHQEAEVRKQAEAALRESEEQLELISNTVPALISYVDTDGRYRACNDAYTQWFGLSREQIIGKPMPEVLGKEAWEIVGPHLETALAGTRVEYEAELKYQRGGARWVHAAYAPAFDKRRTVIGVIVMVTDITALKKSEESLREADRRKDEYLAMVSHELRNPLAAVSNAVQLLMRGDADAVTARSASEILDRQVRQMMRQVDDLLDVTRISRGKIELRKEHTDLTSVVKHAVEAVRPVSDGLRHELTITLPSAPVYVQGDSVRLCQVVSNLLTNACKFTDKGGRIRLTVEQESDHAVMRVKDNGIGLAADDLPRIFETFAQVDRSLERSREGLGLGLALVKNLVELHGGSVEALSEGLGKGSEFVVRLPALSGSQPGEPPKSADHKPVATTPRRILVVDDNRDSAKSMAMLLTLMGHTVETAHDGLEAVQRAGTFSPDVMLLDIGMPGLNGYQAAQRIRQQHGQKNIKLVALTGWGQEEDHRLSQEAGFDAHFVKPVDLDALTRLLAELRS